jgi:DNA-binding response OmpR family regulator
MDTHAEFRISERDTLAIRLAVVIGVLALGLITGANPIGVSALAVGFAIYTAALQFVLLPRFQTDTWIYGMISADALFSGAVAIVLGLPGPTVAVPALFTIQAALFLDYRGAAVSASLGIVATIGGGLVASSNAIDALSSTVPVITGVAALSAYIASSRFSERAVRRQAGRVDQADSGAAMMLAGLRPIASANDETTALDALTRSILTITGLDAVAVYTRAGGLGLQKRVVLTRDGDNEAANAVDGSFEESMHGESAAARAAAQGVALSLGSIGVGGQSASEQMPAWATQMGYNSGVVAPMVVGHLTAGVVFGLRRDQDSVTLEQIDLMERFVALSARVVAAHNSGTQPASRNRLSLELDAAGRAEIGEARPIITMDGLTLDPATDRSSVVGVPVSLSRSEFNLLYALAGSPGQVVDPGSLIESAFSDAPDSGQRTVDTTIYRLRRKLSRVPSGEDLIRTVRGKGYLLVPPVVDSTSDQVSATAD